MKKIIIIIILIIVTILVFFVIKNPSIIGLAVEENPRSFTTAICDENNYCEDYEIKCKGNELINTIATGSAIQHNEDWEDPRGEQKDNLCG